MRRSPFSRTSPFLLLFGRVFDTFCLPDTRVVPLRRYLQLHLHAIGFDRVAFHDPISGVSVFERTPEHEGDAPVAEPSQPAPAQGTGQMIGGPMGMQILSAEEGGRAVPTARRAPPPTSRPTQQQQSAATPTRHLTRISDSELISFIDGYFESPGKSAFVFEDLDHLISGFNQAATSLFRALIRGYMTKHKMGDSIIFITNKMTAATFVPDVSDNRHFLHDLRDQFFNQDSTPRDTVICIDPPGIDEVLNRQRGMRLQQGLPTDFRLLQANCEALAGTIRTQQGVEQSCLKHVDAMIATHDWTRHERQTAGLDALRAMSGREQVAAYLEAEIERARRARAQTAPKSPAQESAALAVERLLTPDPGTEMPRINLSYLFIGNPGTGKTEIARLFARAFREAGVLRQGHFIEASVEDLVAGYVGQTALKTSELLSRARGGVLFIDEVQRFDKEDQFHREAVRTLLKYVEDFRGDISVILATYPEEIDGFLSIDQGLPRRFPNRVDFDDYSPEVCRDIFLGMAGAKDIPVAEDFEQVMPDFFRAWQNDRMKKHGFANAGSVRNMVDGMENNYRMGDENALTAAHLPSDLSRYYERATASMARGGSVEDILAELDALHGLDTVKAILRNSATTIQAHILRGQDASKVCPGHYTFEGRPGTGKTTVAGLLGDIFRDFGVLRSGHVEETTGAALRAKSADAVRAIAGRAKDGVLFIDEAHALLSHPGDSIGLDALRELTAILESERNSLCVVLAGYETHIQNLFDADPGWESRFTERLKFSDYGAEDMASIFRSMAAGHKLTLEPALDEALPNLMQRLIEWEGDTFSNARSARKLLERIMQGLDRRLVADPANTDNYQLIMADADEVFNRQ